MSTCININLGNALNHNFYPYQLNLSYDDNLKPSCDKPEDQELSALLKPIAAEPSGTSHTMTSDSFKKFCTILRNKTLCGTEDKGFESASITRTPLSFNDGKNWVLTVVYGGPNF